MRGHFFPAIIVIAGAAALIVAAAVMRPPSHRPAPSAFSGDRALSLIEQQMGYGPRYPGSSGHAQTVSLIEQELRASAKNVSLQPIPHTYVSGKSVEFKNIIVRFFPERGARILIGAHYDTKRFASLDPTTPNEPLPGANDGASGVAVLLELARAISLLDPNPSVGIDLVFFDGEEGDESVGMAGGEAWFPFGSTHFAKKLAEFYPDKLPEAGIVVDMICDKDLNIYKEGTSYGAAPELVNAIWGAAAKTSPAFHNETRHFISDDHAPLAAAGIPMALIIDFDYPYWHTAQDTLDKCSADSLQQVGNALMEYLKTL